MTPKTLHIDETPDISRARMLLGFGGWMDGGQVSTGTIEYLAEHFAAQRVAHIEPEPFYIYSQPGPMEVSALFRPHTRIEEGIITGLEAPEANFYAAPDQRLILFAAREPNLQWTAFADDIFTVAKTFNVERMCFVGSVSGLLPHTRKPLFWSTATDPVVRQAVRKQGLNPTNYEGPASFATYLVKRAQEVHMPMATVVVGVPPYIQGRNYHCIDAVMQKVNGILELDLDLTGLSSRSEDFLKRLEIALQQRPDFADQVRKLEEHYDQELQGVHDDELKQWFQKQGFRVE